MFDEAHQILTDSSYRTAFAQLVHLSRQQIPRVFLTATLPPVDELHFRRAVGLDLSAKIYRQCTNVENVSHNVITLPSGADRPSLATCVSSLMSLLALSMHPQDRGIVFCNSKSLANEIAARFMDQDTYHKTMMRGGRLAHAVHHSDVPASAKSSYHEAWREGEYTWMSATSGFIHGVDYPHVRYSIFAGKPHSLTELIQGAGRCGRTGEKAVVFVVVEQDDLGPLSQRLTDFKHLNELRSYLTTSDCRRLIISRTMDGYAVSCGMVGGEVCDNCSYANQIVTRNPGGLSPSSDFCRAARNVTINPSFTPRAPPSFNPTAGLLDFDAEPMHIDQENVDVVSTGTGAASTTLGEGSRALSSSNSTATLDDDQLYQAMFDDETLAGLDPSMLCTPPKPSTSVVGRVEVCLPTISEQELFTTPFPGCQAQDLAVFDQGILSQCSPHHPLPFSASPGPQYTPYNSSPASTLSPQSPPMHLFVDMYAAKLKGMRKLQKRDQLSVMLSPYVGKCPICLLWHGELVQRASGSSHQLRQHCRRGGFITNILGWLDLKKVVRAKKLLAGKKVCYACWFPVGSYTPSCHSKELCTGGLADCPFDDWIPAVLFSLFTDEAERSVIPPLFGFPQYQGQYNWMEICALWMVEVRDDDNCFMNAVELFMWYWGTRIMRWSEDRVIFL